MSYHDNNILSIYLYINFYILANSTLNVTPLSKFHFVIYDYEVTCYTICKLRRAPFNQQRRRRSNLNRSWCNSYGSKNKHELLTSPSNNLARSLCSYLTIARAVPYVVSISIQWLLIHFDVLRIVEALT